MLDSRSPVVVDAVDLSTNENTDPAVAPLLLIGQQVWNQQCETCRVPYQTTQHSSERL